MKKIILLFLFIATTVSAQKTNLPKPHWIIINRPSSNPSTELNPAAHHIWLLIQKPAIVNEQTPLVLILPMLGGINLWAEQRISQRLAERGMASAIMPLPQQFERRYFLDTPNGKLFLERDINQLGNNMHEALQDIDYVLTWLSNKEASFSQLQWQPRVLAISGISLGGITAALAMNKNKNLQAGAFMLAGAGLGKIITQGSLTRKLSKKLGYTAEILDERLHDFDINPLTWDQRPVLLAQARWDHVVPDFAQQKLRDLTPHALVIHLPSGHVTAIAHIFWVEDKIADFFQENLK